MIRLKQSKVDEILELLIILSFLFLSFIYSSIYIVIPYFLLVIYIIQTKPVISPMYYFFIPWGFMILVYFSELIKYKNSINNSLALQYIFLGIILIYTGYYIGQKVFFSNYLKRLNIKKYINLQENYTDNNMVLSFITILAIMGIIGSLLFTIEMLLVVKIDITNASLTRNLFEGREVSNFSRIGNILAWGALISLSSAIILWDAISKKNKLIWLLSPSLYALFSVLSSGRQAVFQILIVIISSLAIKKNSKNNEINVNKRKRRFITVIAIFLVFLLIILYGFLLASFRNDNLISNSKKHVLEVLFKVNFHPYLNRILNSLPDLLRDGLTEAIVYFTHQIPEFTLFWEIPEFGPFYGLYSLPFIDRRLYSIGLTEYSVEYKMQFIRESMAKMNAMPVSWRTFFSFLIVDFGKPFSLVVCLLIGFVCAKIFNCYKTRKSLFSALLLIRANVGMFYTIMFPASSDTILLFMLLFCLIMVYWENKNTKWYIKV